MHTLLPPLLLLPLPFLHLALEPAYTLQAHVYCHAAPLRLVSMPGS